MDIAAFKLNNIINLCSNAPAYDVRAKGQVIETGLNHPNWTGRRFKKHDSLSSPKYLKQSRSDVPFIICDVPLWGWLIVEIKRDRHKSTQMTGACISKKKKFLVGANAKICHEGHFQVVLVGVRRVAFKSRQTSIAISKCWCATRLRILKYRKFMSPT